MEKIVSLKKQSKWILIAALSSVLSMGALGYLTLLHYQLKLGLAEGKSVCNVGETFNCDTVNMSSYGSLFSIPISLWGLFTHAIFLLFLFIAWLGITTRPQLSLRLALWLSLWIAGTSIVMGTLSTVALKSYCLFCLTAYVLSFIQLGAMIKMAGGKAASFFLEDLRDLVSHGKWMGLSLLAIPALATLTHSMILDNYGFKEMNLVVQESLANWKASPLQNFDLNKGLAIRKNGFAQKMVLVEFADYLCPHCRHALPTLHAFVASRPGVQFIFKSFPLDGTCNPAIPRKGDGLRCELAYAAHCAEKLQHKGFELQHLIFERQPDWSISTLETNLSQLASQLGLPLEEFKACCGSSETHDSIVAQAQEGATAKIMGTPSIFANGHLLERGQFMPVLEAAYDEILSK